MVDLARRGFADDDVLGIWVAVVTDVGDQLFAARRFRARFALERIGSEFATCWRRPYIADEHLEQEGFAGTVRTVQRPTLAGSQLEVDVIENDVVVEDQGTVPQRDQRQRFFSSGGGCIAGTPRFLFRQFSSPSRTLSFPALPPA